MKWTNAKKEKILRGLEAALARGESYSAYAESVPIHISHLRSMRVRYLKRHPEFNPSAPSKAIAVRMAPVDVPKRSRDARSFSPQEAQATVREYMSLTQAGDKKKWLKEQGLSYATMFNLKIRAAKAQPEFHAPAALNGSFVPASVQTMSPVSLEDAILALEVKRDHYTSVIEDLKRMMRGQ